jgi:hypothetical protein
MVENWPEQILRLEPAKLMAGGVLMVTETEAEAEQVLPSVTVTL